MAERHQQGIEKAIDRLEQVCEELECHREKHTDVVIREIEKVKRKKLKITRKIIHSDHP